MNCNQLWTHLRKGVCFNSCYDTFTTYENNPLPLLSVSHVAIFQVSPTSTAK